MKNELSKQKTEVIYHEVKLEDVLKYFEEGFKFNEGTSKITSEHFLDNHKKVVIFKIYLDTTNATNNAGAMPIQQ